MLLVRPQLVFRMLPLRTRGSWFFGYYYRLANVVLKFQAVSETSEIQHISIYTSIYTPETSALKHHEARNVLYLSRDNGIGLSIKQRQLRLKFAGINDLQNVGNTAYIYLSGPITRNVSTKAPRKYETSFNC